MRDDLRLGACGVKIRHDVLDTRAVIEIHRVLKVQVQTAVIKVDRADDGLAVVADEHLRVHEAGRILIDLHPGVEQLAVMPLGEGEGELLVRHVRQNELHVHAALGRERERHDHRLVEDEVRRHDAHIALGVVEDVEIHALAHTLVVERAVGIRQDVAARARQRAQGHIEIAAVGIGVRLALVHAPHLQEHERERAHGLALEAHGRVLPHAVDAHEIGIFIGEVHAAGEADAPVDDGDLAVVAVVVIRAHERAQRREHLAADAERLHALGVAVGQAVERARAVIEYAHLDAGAHPLLQDLQDAAPDVALLDDEIFKENEVLGRLQRLDERADLVLPHGVVGDGSVFIHGVVAGAQRVLGEVVHLGQLGAQAGHELGLARDVLHGAQDALLHAAVGVAVADIELHEQVQQHAERGQRHDEDDPGDLRRRAAGLVDEVDDDRDAHHAQNDRQRGVVAAEIVRAEHHDGDLQHEQQRDDHRAAKHNVEQSALAAVQQADLIVVLKPVFVHARTSFRVVIFLSYPKSRKRSRDIPVDFPAARRGGKTTAASRKQLRDAAASVRALNACACFSDTGPTGR